MKIRQFSITGYWSQPNFPALTNLGGRTAFVIIENTQKFCGHIVIDDRGNILNKHSVISDGNGGAEILGGKLNLATGKISFVKKYFDRNDRINYEATTMSQDGTCWDGTFNGAATGPGMTRFDLHELSEDLFKMGEE